MCSFSTSANGANWRKTRSLYIYIYILCILYILYILYIIYIYILYIYILYIYILYIYIPCPCVTGRSISRFVTVSKTATMISSQAAWLPRALPLIPSRSMGTQQAAWVKSHQILLITAYSMYVCIYIYTYWYNYIHTYILHTHLFQICWHTHTHMYIYIYLYKIV